MSYKKTEIGVQKLVISELCMAVDEYGPFASRHEAAGVIREEVEELQAEMSNVDYYHRTAWNDIKYGRPNLTDWIAGLKESAIKAACEAIQVAAMAQKLMDFERDE